MYKAQESLENKIVQALQDPMPERAFSSAKVHYESALDLMKTHGKTFNVASLLESVLKLAGLAYRQQQSTAVETYLQEAITLLLPQVDQQSGQDFYQKAGDLWLELGRPMEALPYYGTLMRLQSSDERCQAQWLSLWEKQLYYIFGFETIRAHVNRLSAHQDYRGIYRYWQTVEPMLSVLCLGNRKAFEAFYTVFEMPLKHTVQALVEERLGLRTIFDYEQLLKQAQLLLAYRDNRCEDIAIDWKRKITNDADSKIIMGEALTQAWLELVSGERALLSTPASSLIQYQKTLLRARTLFRETVECFGHTGDISAGQAEYTRQVCALIADIAKEVTSFLGDAPCDYAVIGLGSVSREALSPHSDLECALVIAEEQHRGASYFQALIEIMDCILQSIEVVSFTTEPEQIKRMGLQIDASFKNLLYAKNTKRAYFLINTPRGFIQYFEQLDTWQGLNLDNAIFSLLSPCLLYARHQERSYTYREATDCRLWLDYKAQLRAYCQVQSQAEMLALHFWDRCEPDSAIRTLLNTIETPVQIEMDQASIETGVKRNLLALSSLGIVDRVRDGLFEDDDLFLASSGPIAHHLTQARFWDADYARLWQGAINFLNAKRVILQCGFDIELDAGSFHEVFFAWRILAHHPFDFAHISNHFHPILACLNHWEAFDQGTRQFLVQALNAYLKRQGFADEVVVVCGDQWAVDSKAQLSLLVLDQKEMHLQVSGQLFYSLKIEADPFKKMILLASLERLCKTYPTDVQATLPLGAVWDGPIEFLKILALEWQLGTVAALEILKIIEAKSHVSVAPLKEWLLKAYAKLEQMTLEAKTLHPARLFCEQYFQHQYERLAEEIKGRRLRDKSHFVRQYIVECSKLLQTLHHALPGTCFVMDLKRLDLRGVDLRGIALKDVCFDEAQVHGLQLDEAGIALGALVNAEGFSQIEGLSAQHIAELQAQKMQILEALLARKFLEIQHYQHCMEALDVLDHLVCKGSPPNLDRIEPLQLPYVASLLLCSSQLNQDLPSNHFLSYERCAEERTHAHFLNQIPEQLKAEMQTVLESRGFLLAPETIALEKSSKFTQFSNAIIESLFFSDLKGKVGDLNPVQQAVILAKAQEGTALQKQLKARVRQVLNQYDQGYIDALIDNLNGQTTPDSASDRLKQALSVATGNIDLLIDLRAVDLAPISFEQFSLDQVRVRLTEAQVQSHLTARQRLARRYALSEAIKAHRFNEALALLADGADLNTPDEEGRTAFMVACMENEVGFVELLLEQFKGIHLEAQTRSGRRIIKTLCQLGYQEMVNVLRRYGAALDLEDAVMIGDIETVAQLYPTGRDINAFNLDGKTLLTVAVESDQCDMARYLLDRYLANPRIVIGDPKTVVNGTTVLHLACARGSESMVSLLLNYSPDLNAHNKDKATPLRVALDHQHFTVATLLVESGAEVDVYSAIQLGRREEAERLMKSNSKSVDAQGRSFLHWAVQSKQQDLMAWLLAQGVAIDPLDHRQRTPLYEACARGDSVSAQWLIQAGAEVKLAPKLLQVAISQGHDAIVALLLAQGADPNTIWCGRPILHEAIRHRRRGAVQRLLEAGASLLALDGQEGTQLYILTDYGVGHHLQQCSTPSIVLKSDQSKALLIRDRNTVVRLIPLPPTMDRPRLEHFLSRVRKNGTGSEFLSWDDPIMQSIVGSGHVPQGNLALHLAVESGDAAIVAVLVKAYLDIPNPVGKTALALAEVQGHEAVKHYLEAFQFEPALDALESMVTEPVPVVTSMVAAQAPPLPFFSTGLYARSRVFTEGQVNVLRPVEETHRGIRF